MSVKIRLSRAGAKKKPYYKVVAATVTAPRDGKFLEKLGTYNPLAKDEDPQKLVLKVDRIQAWMKNGAKPTERVEKLIKKFTGIISKV